MKDRFQMHFAQEHDATIARIVRRVGLFGAIPLSVFQVFVPGFHVAGVPIPLAFLSGVLLLPNGLLRMRALLSWRPTVLIFGILFAYVVSIGWSVDPRLAVPFVGYVILFLLIFAGVAAEGKQSERFVLWLLRCSIAFSAVQAVLIVLFRAEPIIKIGFLISPAARWFVSPNVLDVLFTTQKNNVVDPAKSGGYIVNANVAAAYMGIMALAAFGIFLISKKKRFAILSLFLLMSVCFTGSKAGIVLATLLSCSALLAVAWRKPKWRIGIVLVALSIGAVGGVTAVFSIIRNGSDQVADIDSFASRSEATLGVRETIWGYALQEFPQHALQGQGFGGWQQGFPQYALAHRIGPGFPPHNTLIYLWSQGGLLAALLGIVFMYRVIVIGWRQIRKDEPLDLAIGVATTFAFLWTFAQGMGENFGLLGEAHMSPILATLLALIYMHRRSNQAPMMVNSP